jgi:hypothetical protein
LELNPSKIRVIDSAYSSKLIFIKILHFSSKFHFFFFSLFSISSWERIRRGDRDLLESDKENKKIVGLIFLTKVAKHDVKVFILTKIVFFRLNIA